MSEHTSLPSGVQVRSDSSTVWYIRDNGRTSLVSQSIVEKIYGEHIAEVAREFRKEWVEVDLSDPLCGLKPIVSRCNPITFA